MTRCADIPGLVDELRVLVRVASTATDAEIELYADAALADLERAGVSPEYLGAAGPLVRQAVATHVKAEYGFDNADAERLQKSYSSLKAELLNSPSVTGAGA